MPQPLPDPNFIDRDAQAITRDMVSQYEAAAGKTLYPAQPERLMVDVIAYRETLLRIAIQEAAEQNLVRFARAPMLDYLGELVCVRRLPARQAQCQILISLDQPRPQDVLIPSGAGLRAKDGQTFVLKDSLAVPAGARAATATAMAASPGGGANGFLPGEIVSAGDGLWPAGVTAANADTSSGGADPESDDRLRSRILLGPEGFAVAGPAAAYQASAMGVHQDIIDVGVRAAWPGLVAIAPLTKDGQPSPGLLSLVADALNAADVRPLSDQVVVMPPGRVPFEINAAITLCAWADQTPVMTAVQNTLKAYVAELRLKLGREIIPSRFITQASDVPGVYAVELASPTATTPRPDQYADCTGITLTFAGYGNAD